MDTKDTAMGRLKWLVGEGLEDHGSDRDEADQVIAEAIAEAQSKPAKELSDRELLERVSHQLEQLALLACPACGPEEFLRIHPELRRAPAGPADEPALDDDGMPLNGTPKTVLEAAAGNKS